jgi:hypothetical protein
MRPGDRLLRLRSRGSAVGYGDQPCLALLVIPRPRGKYPQQPVARGYGGL